MSTVGPWAELWLVGRLLAMFVGLISALHFYGIIFGVVSVLAPSKCTTWKYYIKIYEAARVPNNNNIKTAKQQLLDASSTSSTAPTMAGAISALLSVAVLFIRIQCAHLQIDNRKQIFRLVRNHVGCGKRCLRIVKWHKWNQLDYL